MSRKPTNFFSLLDPPQAAVDCGFRIMMTELYTVSLGSDTVGTLRDVHGNPITPGLMTGFFGHRTHKGVIGKLRLSFAKAMGVELKFWRIIVPVVMIDHPRLLYSVWMDSDYCLSQNIIRMLSLSRHTFMQLSKQLLPEVHKICTNVHNFADVALEHRNVFPRMFTAPSFVRLRQVQWAVRGTSFLLPEKKGATTDRSIVNFATVRPDWIFDIRPVDGKSDPLLGYRNDAHKLQARIAEIVDCGDVTDEMGKAKKFWQEQIEKAQAPQVAQEEFVSQGQERAPEAEPVALPLSARKVIRRPRRPMR